MTLLVAILGMAAHTRELFDLPTFQGHWGEMLNSDTPLYRELGTLCIQEFEEPCAQKSVAPGSIMMNAVQCSSGNAVSGHTVNQLQEWLQFPKDHCLSLQIIW